jgi:CHAT domain-containing protein/predicted negative regulator of RcsB-dependent stress response
MPDKIRRTARSINPPRVYRHTLSTLLSAFLLTCFTAAPTGTVPCFSATATTDEGAINSDAPRELRPGSSITQEIFGSGSQAYEIQLSARQYLRLSLYKGDSNLALSFYDPHERKTAEFAGRYQQVVEASLIAELPGRYQVEVRSLEKETTASSHYELKIEHVGDVTARDVKDNAALKVYAEADKLRAEWTEVSLRKAIEKLTEAWLVWRAAGRPRNAIEALKTAAEAHFTLGEYRQALNLSRQALAESRRVGERPREVELINYTAHVLSNLGDNEQARKALEGVLDYYDRQGRGNQPPQEKSAHAEALNSMGEVFYSMGDPIKALDYFRSSLVLWIALRDRRGEAQSRLFAGYALSNSGDQKKALVEFNRALELFRTLEDRRGEALSLTALGSLHSLSGEEQAAIDLHFQAMSIFRTIGDHQSEAVTLNGVGQAYEDLNEKQVALDNYKQALRLFQDSGSLDFAAVTEYQIAKVYHSLADIEQALAHYNRCISLSREANKRRIEVYALNDIAAIHDSRGQRQATLGQYQKILKIYREIGDRRGQAIALNSIGDFFFSAGQQQRALVFYQQALPLIRAAGDREGETATLYNVARAAQAIGDLTSALSYAEQSLQVIEELRAQVFSPDLRSSYFASVHKHYGLYIDLLMQLDSQQPGHGFDAAALVASESARARSLLETLAEINEDIRQGVDPSLLERERTLQQALRAKSQYQIQLSGSKEAEVAEVAREIRGLSAEYNVVQAQLREQNPRYSTLEHPKPISLEDAQAELRDDNTLLLEYALGDERSYLWAVTSNSLKSYVLPARATLEEAAREVYTLLTARQQVGEQFDPEYQARVAASDQQYAEKSLALSKLLLGPVTSQLGNKRLLIIADGVLQYIPFEALPTPDLQQNAEHTQGTPNLDDLPLLVSQHEVISLPSISTLAAIRRERPSGDPQHNGVAVLADPVFDKYDPRVERLDDSPANAAPVTTREPDGERMLRDFDGFTGGAGIPRLPFTLQEATAILKLTPDDQRMIATGFEANRDAMLNSRLGQYQVIHLATHSLINNEHPELSGILLSMVNKKGEPENGFLQLHDIYNLRLSADLVVLSACSTGLGKEVRGEGLVGLTRGFMYAGSKSVVASLWKVDDRATAELMSYFYQAMLTDGVPPATALKLAKEKMRQQKRWRAPYYWAAFILQGEYRGRVQVNNASRSFLNTGASSLIVIICLLCSHHLIKRRRKTVFAR